MGTMGGGSQRSISVSRARSTWGTFEYVLISDGRRPFWPLLKLLELLVPRGVVVDFGVSLLNSPL